MHGHFFIDNDQQYLERLRDTVNKGNYPNQPNKVGMSILKLYENTTVTFKEFIMQLNKMTEPPENLYDQEYIQKTMENALHSVYNENMKLGNQISIDEAAVHILNNYHRALPQFTKMINCTTNTSSSSNDMTNLEKEQETLNEYQRIINRSKSAIENMSYTIGDAYTNQPI